MPLLRVSDLSLAYGHHVLLEHANFQLMKGDRVCLLGRNGAGKSTLLKLVDGQIHADGGDIWRRPGLRVSKLDQELPKADDREVAEVVGSGLAELGQWLSDYHSLAQSTLDARALARLEQLQHKIEAADGWRYQQQIDETLSRLQLPAGAKMNSLSGGWRRRVALAKALVTAPDVLLLDEPTNHLDVETIQWLEKQLLDFNGAVLFITHDRALVRRLATRIVELDRGQLRSFDMDYEKYLEEREHLLEIEEQNNALFDKRLAQEEVWIRQGIKARRTRNEGRVRALEQLRRERAARRERQGSARITLEAAASSGKLVAELQQVCYAIEGRTIVSDLSLNIIRGDKIGLIGPNGVGKTTLLKLILGQLQPTSGVIKHGTKLDIAYFDQMRDLLEDEKTIVDTVGQGRESIEINGKSRHVLSYLSDFLFTPERARTPLKALSGGERNRVQLACLFSQPANLLVMDEPTNDLDVETLELLETILVEFPGTLLLVSHDREFMDNVVSSTLAFEGQGQVKEYVGGFSDWLRQGGHFSADSGAGKSAEKPSERKTETAPQGSQSGKKLSYKLQRELDELPEKIEALERDQQLLAEEIAAPEFYHQSQQHIEAKLKRVAEIEARLEASMERWLELSEGQ